MSNLTRAMMMGAAGAGGAGEYVDDLFSTYLHEGVNSSSTINNGIDLSGEGGLVWVKSRTQTYNNWAFDTERGVTKQISFSLDHSEATEAKSVTAFNSNGFDIGGSGGDCGYNCSGQSFVYWTFRKCPGFFDIITYTGNGNASGRTLSHSLGSAPGSIWIKRYTPTSAGEDWVCYHRSVGTAGQVRINKTISYPTSSPAFANVTATSFDLIDADAGTNANNETYVAYIFAHDDRSFGDNGNESIIKCGNYTGTGAAGNQITLGFEPQWLIVKNTSSNQNWEIFDNMRGVVTGGIASELFPNTNGAERNSFNIFNFNTTGFETESTLDETNANGDNYIYIAIRRPHKPPEAGTEVFAVDNNDTGSYQTGENRPSFISNFPVDLYIRRNQMDNSDSPEFGTRLINRRQNITDTSSSNDLGTSVFPYNNGVLDLHYVRATDYVWMFKRAPGFLDIVAYSGNSTSGRAVSHNLGVVPELMVFKSWDGNRAWRVYDANTGAGGSLRLNADAAKDSNSAYFSTPTADNIILGNDNDTNSSSYDYIAYLFATIPGVSKVGSFSGTGNDINVDCGFTAGARFLLIKRTDSSGDWYLYDSLRGIVSGNDPYYLLNSNNPQVTNTDYIDPLNAGFTVTSSAPAALNTSGGTYIFLAIA